MKTVMVTGGAGFFGGILKRAILESGDRCISVDVCPDAGSSIRIWINARSICAIGEALEPSVRRRPDGWRGALRGHAGARLGRSQELWTSNVDGTRNLMDAMRKYGVRQHVFTSTNCLWGEAMGRPVREDDAPNPVELYGRSKLEAERIIREYDDITSVLLRCPTIIDFGRLGLLSILFEFIDEGRRVWAVGGGRNRYQFIYAAGSGECVYFGAGLSSFRHLQYWFRRREVDRGSLRIRDSKFQEQVESRDASTRPAIAAMKLAYHLKLSPLGPYHYKMIAEDFLFDTSRIKERLGWRPTMTNEEMLWRAYQYYSENRREIERRQDVSAHRKGAKMGVIRLLKWVS